jgi:hypothetical protein
MGALLMVMPIENVTYQLTFLNYHFVAFTLLTALFLLFWHYQHPSRWKIIFMWLFLLPTTLIVEATYPLVVAVPILILWREKQLSRRFFRLSVLWLIIPIMSGLFIAFNLFVSSTATTYQQSLIASDNSLPTLIEVSWTIFRSHFWDRWLPALSLSPQTLDSSFVQLSLLTVVVVSGVLYWLMRHDPMLPVRSWCGLTIMAATATVLGFIIFTVAVIRLSFVRTTVFSAPGATVLIVCFVIFCSRIPYWGRVIGGFLGIITLIISQLDVITDAHGIGFPVVLLIGCCIGIMLRPRMAMSLMLGGIIGLGMVYSLTLRQVHRDTNFNTEFMQQLPVQLPALAPNSTLIVIVDTEGYPFIGSFLRLRGALRWLYEEYPLDGAFCNSDQDAVPEFLHCVFNQNTIDTAGVRSARFQTTYDRVIFLRFTAVDRRLTLWDEEDVEAWIGHPIEGYDPYRRIDLDGVPPRRYFTLFPNQTAYPAP